MQAKKLPDREVLRPRTFLLEHIELEPRDQRPAVGQSSKPQQAVGQQMVGIVAGKFTVFGQQIQERVLREVLRSTLALKNVRLDHRKWKLKSHSAHVFDVRTSLCL